MVSYLASIVGTEPLSLVRSDPRISLPLSKGDYPLMDLLLDLRSNPGRLVSVTSLVN